HFGLSARALLTKAMKQTSDPCECNTSPAGACSTDYVDVSRRCGKVHREHATVALPSMTRACRPQRSRQADRERDARAAPAFRSEEIRASARSRQANEDEIWVPRVGGRSIADSSGSEPTDEVKCSGLAPSCVAPANWMRWKSPNASDPPPTAAPRRRCR